MRKTNALWLIGGILLYASTLNSCSSDEEVNIGSEQPRITEAHFTDTIRYEKDKTTAYNFEYSSTDPYGEPITLSATITIGDEIKTGSKARGLMLYNHYTVCRADQCPSRGELGVQKFITGSGLITISPDYYGFGITENRHQAYCISSVNAQASIDALMSAKKLLANKGYTWDDILFNTGYSQGAQTAIAVVRLVNQQYPDIHITYTFAGGGSYDIPETYRQFIISGETTMPSSVVSVLLAYNEYRKLGIPLSSLFKEPLLNHIDEWIYSKKYTSDQIDKKIGSKKLSDWCTAEVLDINSNLSKRFMEVLEQDNLCKGWSPRSDDHIILVHNKSDGAVPAANTNNLSAFLMNNGVENLRVRVENFGSLPNTSAHETGAIIFAAETILKVCDVLKIKIWIDYTRFMELL